MNAAMIALVLTVAPSQAEKGVDAAEKRAFLELLAKLPTRGEVYTAEGVQQAAPHTRVLLALTAEDIGKRDFYPFLALSRGLLDRKEQRDYGAKHFNKIAHPTLKLVWGAVLFHEKAATPEIVTHLRAALDSQEQADVLAQLLGPEFEGFKKRVKEHQSKPKE